MTAAPRHVSAAVLVVAGLGAVMLSGPMLQAGARAADDRVERTLTLAPGQSLAIDVATGSVRVTGVPGRRDVRIVITRQAANAAALGEAAAFDITDAGVRVRPTAGASPDRTRRVEVMVEAPVDLRLDDVTVDDGTLTLRGLRGQVRARVAQGAITAEDVGGVLRLETAIGPVEVTRARLDDGGLIRLRAFNGNVRLAFAAPLEHARVMALALNGTVTSAVPLTAKDGWGPRWAEASIGRADRVVSLDVVTGAIRIEAPLPR